jgi:phosphoadenosine phosphosulfate reductase
VAGEAMIDLFNNESLQQKVDRACDLLREHCPAEGYHLCFSGGKDSCVIDKLAEMSGVKFEKHHNLTTIDAPEVMRFIREKHPDSIISRPKMSMMNAVATLPKCPPTRRVRWCCEMYKERGGHGAVKVLGVRAAESKSRAINWRENAQDLSGDMCICPIVQWSDETLWTFIHAENIPYCKLYDEGFTRLGCVGCPLQSKRTQDLEFLRWPKYEQNWRKAIIANWVKYHAIPRKDGKPRYHAKFRCGEDFWIWWRTTRAPDYFRDDCQGGLMFTNAPEIENEVGYPLSSGGE